MLVNADAPGHAERPPHRSFGIGVLPLRHEGQNIKKPPPVLPDESSAA